MQRTREQVFQKIAALGAELNREHDLERLLELILDRAVELLGAERGLIVLVEEGRPRVACARNMDKESLERPQGKFSRTVLARAAGSGAPVAISDAREDPSWSEVESIGDLALVSVLAVPLRIGSETAGAVYLDNRHVKGAFDAFAQDALALLADLAGAALGHARLHRENQRMRERLAEAARLLEKEAARERDKATLAREELARARAALGESAPPEGALVGASVVMRRVRDLVERFKDAELPVLIEGESGTGKGVLAREIHDRSLRARGPFVAENVAAIPETLAASVLFGHAKGAFTGAGEMRKGLFELAHGGTLFLDEIGEISPELQKSLLRVLEERKVRRVGEGEERSVDVRIVSATNKNLRELVQRGEFREDLYYRLSTLKMAMPPLRARREDVPRLVEHFSGAKAREHGLSSRPFSADAIARLVKHAWPGNVRELRNVVERSLLMARGSVVNEPDLLFDAEGESAPETRAEPKAPPKAATGLTERQERILEKARARGSTGVAEVMQEEQVSRATAHRDLSELVAAGKLTAVGKAATTRYVPT